MDNYQLLQQILSTAEVKLSQTDELPDNLKINVWVDFGDNEMTLTHSIGPLEPRTRTAKFSPVSKGHEVEYGEVSHGMVQSPTVAVIDTNNAAEVKNLVNQIWIHLRGD